MYSLHSKFQVVPAWVIRIILISLFAAWVFESDAASTDNWMAFTGYLCVFFALFISIVVDREKQIEIIERWEDSGIIDIPEGKKKELESRMNSYDIKCKAVSMLLALVSTAIAYVVIFSEINRFDTVTADFVKAFVAAIFNSDFIATSLFSAVLIGWRLGRMFAHCMIGTTLKKHGAQFRLLVGHIDGVGGWARIGRFYIWQTAVLVIGFLWLAGWLIIIEFYPDASGYEPWVNWFLVLLVSVVIVFTIAIGWPILVFARSMRRLKKDLKPEIEAVRAELFTLVDGKSVRSSDLVRRHELTVHLSDLCCIPNLPISGAVLTSVVSFVVLGIGVALVPSIPELIEFIPRLHQEK